MPVLSRFYGIIIRMYFQQAEAMFFELVKQMSAREGVTEQLKAQDQMLWVQRMNNIRDRAMEVVNSDLIYA